MRVGVREPRTKAAGALALALLAGAGCVDPPAQPQVSVTIVGISMAGNTTSGTFLDAGADASVLSGADDVSIALYFRHAPDADAGRDAGADASASADASVGWDPSTEERRVFSWHHTDPETHVVQLPDRLYDSVRIEVSDAIDCPDASAPGTEILGRGSIAIPGGLRPQLGGEPVRLTVSPVSDPTQCSP